VTICLLSVSTPDGRSWTYKTRLQHDIKRLPTDILSFPSKCIANIISYLFQPCKLSIRTILSILHPANCTEPKTCTKSLKHSLTAVNCPSSHVGSFNDFKSQMYSGTDIYSLPRIIINQHIQHIDLPLILKSASQSLYSFPNTCLRPALRQYFHRKCYRENTGLKSSFQFVLRTRWRSHRGVLLANFFIFRSKGSESWLCEREFGRAKLCNCTRRVSSEPSFEIALGDYHLWCVCGILLPCHPTHPSIRCRELALSSSPRSLNFSAETFALVRRLTSQAGQGVGCFDFYVTR